MKRGRTLYCIAVTKQQSLGQIVWRVSAYFSLLTFIVINSHNAKQPFSNLIPLLTQLSQKGFRISSSAFCLTLLCLCNDTCHYHSCSLAQNPKCHLQRYLCLSQGRMQPEDNRKQHYKVLNLSLSCATCAKSPLVLQNVVLLTPFWFSASTSWSKNKYLLPLKWSRWEFFLL